MFGVFMVINVENEMYPKCLTEDIRLLQVDIAG